MTLFAPFICKSDQDRLGTNIGKAALKKRVPDQRFDLVQGGEALAERTACSSTKHAIPFLVEMISFYVRPEPVLANDRVSQDNGIVKTAAFSTSVVVVVVVVDPHAPGLPSCFSPFLQKRVFS